MSGCLWGFVSRVLINIFLIIVFIVSNYLTNIDVWWGVQSVTFGFPMLIQNYFPSISKPLVMASKESATAYQSFKVSGAEMAVYFLAQIPLIYVLVAELSWWIYNTEWIAGLAWNRHLLEAPSPPPPLKQWDKGSQIAVCTKNTKLVALDGGELCPPYAGIFILFSSQSIMTANDSIWRVVSGPREWRHGLAL